MVTPAGPAEVDVMVALHALSFDDAWPRHVLAPSLGMPGSFAFLAVVDDEPAGFALLRVHAGEGEVMTLCVSPEMRRHGIARSLLLRGIERAAALGGEAMFLEVAEDNVAALGLYAALGFGEVGRRKGYYKRSGLPVDALLMRRTLSLSES